MIWDGKHVLSLIIYLFNKKKQTTLHQKKGLHAWIFDLEFDLERIKPASSTISILSKYKNLSKKSYWYDVMVQIFFDV